MQNRGNLQKVTANFVNMRLKKGRKNVDSFHVQLHWPHNQVYLYLHHFFRKKAAADRTNLYFNEFIVIIMQPCCQDCTLYIHIYYITKLYTQKNGRYLKKKMSLIRQRIYKSYM